MEKYYCNNNVNLHSKQQHPQYHRSFNNNNNNHLMHNRSFNTNIINHNNNRNHNNNSLIHNNSASFITHSQNNNISSIQTNELPSSLYNKHPQGTTPNIDYKVNPNKGYYNNVATPANNIAKNSFFNNVDNNDFKRPPYKKKKNSK